MIKRKRYKPQEASLTNRLTINVRFSEVDAMRIVWHGEYIRYFEDGRESFGKHYGLGYWDMYNNGYTAPIVDLTCQYHSPLTFGDQAIIETRYIATDAAKIIFEYTVFQADGITPAATGTSMQVFLNNNNELELTNPEFYLDWKKKWGII